MSRESEERLRELCRKLIATGQDSPDFPLAVNQLRTVLRDHCDRTRAAVTAKGNGSKRQD